MLLSEKLKGAGWTGKEYRYCPMIFVWYKRRKVIWPLECFKWNEIQTHDCEIEEGSFQKANGSVNGEKCILVYYKAKGIWDKIA